MSFRVHILIKIFGIFAFVFLSVTNVANATPFAYITNVFDNSVSVIDTTTNTVTNTVTDPLNRLNSTSGVTVNSAGTRVYVTNDCDNGTVSVIDTLSNTVVACVPVGGHPWGITVIPDGSKVYVACQDSNNISVIDTTNNTIRASVPVGIDPMGVAVSPDGAKVYVTNYGSHNVSVIDTTNDTVIATVNFSIGGICGVAVTPDSKKVFVTIENNKSVSVIDTANDSVTATVPVGNTPEGITVNTAGTRVYVANLGDNSVSVIDIATNNVTAIVPVGLHPLGVSVTPDGKKVFVTNLNSNDVSLIDTTTDSVTTTVHVGLGPTAFGQFIVPISPVLLLANFGSNVTSGYAPLSVQFTDLSVNATSWNWSFGDGDTSNIENPIHTYNATGDYIVNLTVSNGIGTDSKTTMISLLNKVILPNANEKFKIEVKPPEGATLSFTRTLPPSITTGEYYPVY